MAIRKLPKSPWAVASSAVLVATLGAYACLVPGCGSGEATEIVAGVVTQMQVPRELHTVAVVVQSGGQIVHCLYYPVADGTVTLPSTLGMQPGGDASAPVTVSIFGFSESPPEASYDCLTGLPKEGEGNVSVLRRRRMPYAPERVVYLPMALKHACVDMDTPCEEGFTCIGGECQPDSIDPEMLADYSDALVFGTSNTCFDVEQCLPSWGVLPAFVVDRASCLFELDLSAGLDIGPPAGLNVVILHEDLSPEVLDLDPLEGFVIPDPAEPMRFQLASSLCNSRYSRGKIAAVLASPLCPSKTPIQPLCAASQRGLIDGTSELASQTVCGEVGEPLEPTASALYVAMDRSAAMASYFGEQGLDQVLALSLDDPAFRNTLVAFKLAPADAAECAASSNSYATLGAAQDVPFSLADLARQAVADRVSDVGNVLADNPPVLWDVVMSAGGAYQALASLEPPSGPGATFNRRGLLLLGNRDFYSRCAGATQSLEQLAADAWGSSDELRTYVVVLGADPSVDQGQHDPYADAQLIAAAGHGQLFDARTDLSAGAEAMVTLAGELGSCLYDPPEGGISTTSFVSYYDPVYAARVDIAHDASCIDEQSAASGWGLDPAGRVRICGAPCEELRDAMRQLSAFGAQAGLGAPAMPLREVPSCAR